MIYIHCILFWDKQLKQLNYTQGGHGGQQDNISEEKKHGQVVQKLNSAGRHRRSVLKAGFLSPPN